MLRPTLLVLCLALATACDREQASAPFTGPVVSVPREKQTVYGVLRRISEPEVPQDTWVLEIQDGTMLRLVGGPTDRYMELENQAVAIIGELHLDEIAVESCEPDTRILSSTSRRR